MQKERITVTLDPEIVVRVDRLARLRDLSRSKLIERLLEVAVEEDELNMSQIASPVLGPVVQSIVDHPKVLAALAKLIGEQLDPEDLARWQDAGARLRRAREQLKDERGRRYDLHTEGA